MEKIGTYKLAGLENYASVEISDDGHNIVQIRFMNISIRMCVDQ